MFNMTWKMICKIFNLILLFPLIYETKYYHA